VAELTGLKESFHNHRNQPDDLLLWVNPGEVKLLRGKSLTLVWTDGTSDQNPYAKLRLKIEPTKLNVRYDVMDEPTRSPSSTSSAGPVRAMEHGAMDMHRHHQAAPAALPEGPATPPSFTASPARSPRIHNGYPPSMSPLPPQAGSSMMPASLAASQMHTVQLGMMRPDAALNQSQPSARPTQMRGPGMPPYVACNSAVVF